MSHREYLTGRTTVQGYLETIDARDEQLTGAKVIQKAHPERGIGRLRRREGKGVEL
jgi:hypothetical protein